MIFVATIRTAGEERFDVRARNVIEFVRDGIPQKAHLAIAVHDRHVARDSVIADVMLLKSNEKKY